jgi:outer membrane protein assembly factor BamB
MRAVALAVLVSSTVASFAHASDWAPRTDVEIVAVDLATGAVKWAYKGTPLGNAHFELYPSLLVAYPNYDNTDKTHPIFLDPKTGAVSKDTRDPKALIKPSSAQWIHGPIVLANGWRTDFDAGNDRTIAFTDPKSKKVAWTIDPGVYAERVLAYKDLALVAWGYLTDEAILRGYKAGAKKPAWSIDFNVLLNKPTKKKDLERLGRVQPQLVGDVLYAQTGPHVFAIEPATGKILWQMNAATATKLKYQPDLYGGALDLAVFSQDGTTLVVAFEKRILALDAKTGALRWHLDPDTFPHGAFPLAHAGVVYLGAGPARKVAVKASP